MVVFILQDTISRTKFLCCCKTWMRLQEWNRMWIWVNHNYGPPTQTNNFAINVTFSDLCTQASQHCSKDCSSPSVASLYKTDCIPACVFTSTQWNEGSLSSHRYGIPVAFGITQDHKIRKNESVWVGVWQLTPKFTSNTVCDTLAFSKPLSGTSPDFSTNFYNEKNHHNCTIVVSLCNW